MKKRNAIILGIGFLLIVAGYAAWCWRPFYLRPTLVYEDGVPPEAKKAVEQWFKDNPYGYSEPFPFTLSNSTHRLAKPWLDNRKVRILFSPVWE